MKSKRNSIQLVDQHVIKTFIKGDYQCELMIYECLKKANVRHATILHTQPEQLTLEYLQGPDLLQLLLRCEQRNESFVFYLDLWFTYMKQFYQATKHYRHGDVHLGNFIYIDDEVVGLDFEQSVIQNPIKDMADIMCYILFYDPIMTSYKQQTIKEWFNKHPWHHDLTQTQWNDELNEAMHRLNLRRNKEYVVDWWFLFDKSDE